MSNEPSPSSDRQAGMHLTRHFVTVGNRRVHYSRIGSGPVVVLLHASPCSFKVLEQPQRVFARYFTALAFDTPGFGLSDLLPMAQPETEDFADALAETLDALGIDQVAVHGRHTGAQVAVEFAARHPMRCSFALTDGFPVFEESVRLSRPGSYLKPIEASWEGAHLLWMWFRYREQHVFWPWNAQDQAHRADTDVPGVDFIHRGVIELLEAGDGYRIGYATAYRHRGLAALADLKVPVCFGWRPGDSLFTNRLRMPDSAWSVEIPREADAAANAELQLLLKHPPMGGTPPAALSCSELPGRTTLDYVTVGASQVLVRRSGVTGAGRSPFVLIHPLPGSSLLLDELVVELARQSDREVIAFDLPGHGESLARSGNDQSVEALAQAALDTLDALGIVACHLVGRQGGATVAVAVAALAPGRVLELTLDSPVALPAAQRAHMIDEWFKPLGDFLPRWDGQHLVQAWHMRRDMALWWPWHDRRRECARAGVPNISPDRLTFEIRESMKQAASFAPVLRAVMGWPLPERLSALKGPIRLLVRANDPWAPCAEALQASAFEVTEVADEAAAIAQRLSA